MFSAAYLCLCLYCMLQLGFLIVLEKDRPHVQNANEHYFLLMLVIALFSFVADIMSSFNTGPDWFFPFAVAGNYLEIVLNTALIPIFYRYICTQISGLDPKLSRTLNHILWAITLLCMVITVYNAFSGQIFYFDRMHGYHRGPLFFIPMTLLSVMMVIVETFLISQKQKIEAPYYRSLVLFLVAPLIGWALQFMIFGLPFSLLGITFAAQMLFANIQSQNMDKDYLTGAFNRQALDNYLQHQIDVSTQNKTFSAVLLDLDDFKSINDHYGHFEGDVALINTVRVLRDCVGRHDLVARYGGDEFCIVLDSDDPKTIEATLARIDNTLSVFSQHENKPYLLSVSMGYAIYALALGNQADSFYRVIDQKMYQQKNARKH